MIGKKDFGCNSTTGSLCSGWPITNVSWMWLKDCGVLNGVIEDCQNNNVLYGYLVRSSGNIAYTGRANTSNIVCIHD